MSSVIEFINLNYQWFLLLSLLLYIYAFYFERKRIPRIPENKIKQIRLSRPSVILFDRRYGRANLVWSIILGSIFFVLGVLGGMHDILS